jgi:hypothetical protein
MQPRLDSSLSLDELSALVFGESNRNDGDEMLEKLATKQKKKI